ncbi:unnamed protein product, partial [Scytosiphon promiscuus]
MNAIQAFRTMAKSHDETGFFQGDELPHAGNGEENMKNDSQSDSSGIRGAATRPGKRTSQERERGRQPAGREYEPFFRQEGGDQNRKTRPDRSAHTSAVRDDDRYDHRERRSLSPATRANFAAGTTLVRSRSTNSVVSSTTFGDGSEAFDGLAISFNSSISSMASFASFGPDKRVLGAGRGENAAFAAKGSFFRTRYHDSMAPQLKEDKREDTDDMEDTEDKERNRGATVVAEVVGRRAGLSMAGSLGVKPPVVASEAVALTPVVRERVIRETADEGAASSLPRSEALMAASATAFRQSTKRVTTQKGYMTPRRTGVLAKAKIRPATPSSGTPGLSSKASAPAPVPAPVTAQTRSLAPPKLWTTLASKSSPSDTSRLKVGPVGAAATAAAGWPSSDAERNSGASTFGTAAEEIRLSAPGDLFDTAPERARGSDAVDDSPVKQPEGARNVERSARGGREETKEAVVADGGLPDRRLRIPPHSYLAALEDPHTSASGEGTEVNTRGYSLPPDIDSIYAAVTSGIPEAVPAVLSFIRGGQAVDELTARNGRSLVESHKNTVFVVTPRGSGGGGGGG